MDIRDKLQLWVIFWSGVVGFVVAKVYQGWAILFHSEGMYYAGMTGYFTGLRTPIWVRAVENPTFFLILTVGFFAFIGVQFVKFLMSLGLFSESIKIDGDVNEKEAPEA